MIGKIYLSNSNGYFEILKELDTSDNRKDNHLYLIKFLKTGFETVVKYHSIRCGKVRDLLYPSVCEKGYVGIGIYNPENNFKEYAIWTSLIQRCYNIKHKAYKSYGAQGIIICDEWLNFQNFCEWYRNNSYEDNLELDKDILANIYNLDNKIYSPSTCLLISSGLNCFICGDNLKTGVYYKNNKYLVSLQNNKKQVHLGTFDTFEEAKQVYAKKKQEFWKEEVEKFNLPIELKDILLKYDFSWSSEIINKDKKYVKMEL